MTKAACAKAFEGMDRGNKVKKKLRLVNGSDKT